MSCVLSFDVYTSYQNCVPWSVQVEQSEEASWSDVYIYRSGTPEIELSCSYRICTVSLHYIRRQVLRQRQNHPTSANKRLYIPTGISKKSYTEERPSLKSSSVGQKCEATRWTIWERRRLHLYKRSRPIATSSLGGGECVKRVIAFANWALYVKKVSCYWKNTISNC